VEALPVHNKLQPATPKKAAIAHHSAREVLGNPDTSGFSTREQSQKSN